MPRLVSLTLLSLLAVPAGGLVYFLTVVLAWELFGFRSGVTPFMFANAFTFGFVALWWLHLWDDDVRWTPKRIERTAGLTFAVLVAGVAVWLATSFTIRETEVCVFLGGTTSIVLWLAGACVLWRDGPNELAASARKTTTVIACPKCGYAMTGLREARCPECGEAYTLDVLFAAQRPDDRMAEA